MGNKTLQEQMIEYRAIKNLTQKECAKLCGISSQTWYSVENGIQSPSKLTATKIRLLIEKG